LLLLDEPTLHLDLKHRVEVMGILRNLCRSQKITVVASLHDVDVAAKVSDRVALIKSGTVTHWGTPEAVLTNRAVADLYDFNGAEFCNHLGGIELHGDGIRGRAFVVAGMGSGAQVYRMLTKRGFSIATGVLHTNDLDYYVARSLGADCTTQPPMEAVTADTTASAGRKIDDCDVVIDCGFEIGSMNQGNLDLLQTALRKGKPIFSLRSRDTVLPESGATNAMIRCDDTVQLIEAIDRQIVVDASRRHTAEELVEA
jgi:iron complex transport system ATP-binding protein